MLAPSRLPSLNWLLNDIPYSDKVIAKHLGVHLRTLQRYRKANSAPLVIYRALYWETRWGLSKLQVENEYGIDVWKQHAKHLKIRVSELEEENERLRSQVRSFEFSSDDVAANGPFFRVG